ncbi:MAG: aminoacetone oxidase family FAD-binding enzyme, partial [Rickettsiales bacterium]|nr:aminoacetone oxidase family FAD-binding enzyme [Rickettsiales bacterium]
MTENKINSNKHYDVIIIGAGAAGLMCAAVAGQRGRNVLLLDHNKNVGDKIRISGGGKCNFTNLNIEPDNYLSQNPYFAISALKAFTTKDFINLVEKHNIAYHEKTLGQLFCDESSKQIIQMLLSECDQGGVTIETNVSVQSIAKQSNIFEIESDIGKFNCNSLVIATGALSIPKMGATDFGYRVAKQFNLSIIPPIAALVPFTFDDKLLAKTKHLSGVSVNATVRCGKRSFTEGLLFTHRGLSGPVILQISSYWNQGDEIRINLLPDIDILEKLKSARITSPKQEVATILAKYLPKKLAAYVASQNDCSGFITDMANK